MPNIRKQRYEQILANNRLTWKTLRGIVSSLNHRTDDFFDDETAKETWRGEDPYVFMEKRIMCALRRLHLLRVPLHYDINHRAYVVREECYHVLFDDMLEDGIEKVNALYDTWVNMRKSVAKETAESTYLKALERLVSAYRDQIFFSEVLQQWQILENDDGTWLSELDEVLHA